MHSITRFYDEVETAISSMGMLEEKFLDRSKNKELQQPHGTRSMIINALKKIHAKALNT